MLKETIESDDRELFVIVPGKSGALVIILGEINLLLWPAPSAKILSSN